MRWQWRSQVHTGYGAARACNFVELRQLMPRLATRALVYEMENKFMANISIIDDDPAITLLIARLLEREGHSVTAYSDGCSAVIAIITRRLPWWCATSTCPEWTALVC